MAASEWSEFLKSPGAVIGTLILMGTLSLGGNFMFQSDLQDNFEELHREVQQVSSQVERLSTQRVYEENRISNLEIDLRSTTQTLHRLELQAIENQHKICP